MTYMFILKCALKLVPKNILYAYNVTQRDGFRQANFNRQMQVDCVTQNNTLTFAAKTFRIVVQRDFITELSVILDFLKADLKYRLIYVKFCFLIGGNCNANCNENCNANCNANWNANCNANSGNV